MPGYQIQVKFRCDDVVPTGSEWRGSFVRGDRRWKGTFQKDENIDKTVVFDLEAGYAMYSCVREQPPRQMSGYSNAQAIV